MEKTNPFEELQARMAQMFAQAPTKDIEANVRALMQQGFAKLELASREQLDLQTDLLARARQQLGELEARVAELEARLPKPKGG